MYDPVSGTFDLEPDRPLVLLLGKVGQEGVLSKLQTSNRQYKVKILESLPENWKSIIDYFANFEISSVLAVISPKTISMMARIDYKEYREKLFELIGKHPNIVFIYEDILKGKTDDKSEHYVYNMPTKQAIKLVTLLTEKFNLNLVPYKRNAEVTTMAEAFLSDTENHLIFRLYIPSGRIWSSESDKFFQLFRDYLSRIVNVKTRLDQYRTENGTIFEIHSEELNAGTQIESKLVEFANFMDLCISDIGAAEQLLQGKGIESREVSKLLAKYAKEAKRLLVDLKHEREQKVLTLRQRLESELLDSDEGSLGVDEIAVLVNLAIPQVHVQEAIQLNTSKLQSITTGDRGGLQINIRPQIINTFNGMVSQEINGNQNFGIEARQLLELIEKLGGSRSQELSSDLHELEDESAPLPGRVVAKARLKKFLFHLGSVGEKVATTLLQKYLETKLGI